MSYPFSASASVTPWFTAKSGSYFQGQSSVSTGTLGTNLLRLNAFPVAQPITIAQIGAELVTAGDAPSLIRLAIFADDGTGFPGALMLDAGSISTGSGNAGTVPTGGVPGVYTITPGTAPMLAPGLYWAGGVVQGVTTTQPVMRTANLGNQFTGGGLTLPAAGAFSGGYSQSSVSGAMPASFNVIGSAGVVATFPRIIFKIQ